jgi:DnaJ-class molecular chaperone
MARPKKVKKVEKEETKVDVEVEGFRCARCAGRGKVKEAWIECPNCKGKGVITHERESLQVRSKDDKGNPGTD